MSKILASFSISRKSLYFVSYTIRLIPALAKSFMQYEPRKVRDEYGFFESDYVVGIIARLVPDKGHEYLIRALRNLEKDFPKLRLLIVGDGKHRGYLEDLSKQLGLMDRIRFMFIDICRFLSSERGCLFWGMLLSLSFL